MTLIPSEIFTKYNEIADSLIRELGVNCTLVYTPRQEECENCILDVLGNKSSGVYKAGGPYPFSDICPYCNGVGYKEVVVSETIKLRINYNRKTFLKLAPNVVVPDGAVQVIGFIADMPKLTQCNHIIVNSDLADYKSQAFVLLHEPMTHGLQQKNYFLVTLSRAPDK